MPLHLQEEQAKKVMNVFDLRAKVENSTATARARTAKNFEEYMKPDNLRLFPCLRWLPSSAVVPRAVHVKFYNRVWRKDDPFWASNSPGTEWNCQCDVEECDDPLTDNSDIPQLPVPRGLEGNPAMTGEIFTNKASYIAKAEGNPEIEKVCNKIVFKSQVQWAKENLKGIQVRNNEFDSPIIFSNRGIKEYMNQPNDNYFIKNEMIKSMAIILRDAKYMGKTNYKGKTSHIFKIEINKKTNYLISNVSLNNDVEFYGISESDRVLEEIKK